MGQILLGTREEELLVSTASSRHQYFYCRGTLTPRDACESKSLSLIAAQLIFLETHHHQAKQACAALCPFCITIAINHLLCFHFLTVLLIRFKQLSQVFVVKHLPL